MLITVAGIYENARIDLVHPPLRPARARVLATFLPPDEGISNHGQMVFGQFTGDRMATEEDFEFAEWQGEAE